MEGNTHRKKHLPETAPTTQRFHIRRTRTHTPACSQGRHLSKPVSSSIKRGLYFLESWEAQKEKRRCGATGVVPLGVPCPHPPWRVVPGSPACWVTQLRRRSVGRELLLLCPASPAQTTRAHEPPRHTALPGLDGGARSQGAPLRCLKSQAHPGLNLAEGGWAEVGRPGLTGSASCTAHLLRIPLPHGVQGRSLEEKGSPRSSIDSGP